MDVSIIISGNLTGFSRFYASPNANDVYNEAKFDFDYRNFLTFLKDGDKAYAISFSPRVIAVSLVTRILDSFRRPGVLVVTALVPRSYAVRGQLNQEDRTALYNLLNEVNDKFYEKNFLNGMVNQNPAVLMQDYYADILSRYVLVNDRMQKPVNARIDVASPNKRIGYVASADSNMPQYLSSVMRKAYEGYHHVFLSVNAPQNIDEPAEEVITYRVRIENDNRAFPGQVKLTDRIPNVMPGQGEKDIPNKNFTYGQVIAGEAGMSIIGTIENGDTILLTYKFPREEKTIHFRFFEGNNELPNSTIRPILVDSDGKSFNLPESYTFIGSEIYSRKTIQSGNPDYTITGTGANLDLQRLPDGTTFNVNVERGFTWEFNPKDKSGRFVTVDPVDLRFTNRYTRESKSFRDVTSRQPVRLSGKVSDWELEIISDYYQYVRVSLDEQYKLEPKPKQTTSANTTAHVYRGNNGNAGQSGNNGNYGHSGNNGNFGNGGNNGNYGNGGNNGLRVQGTGYNAKGYEEIQREKKKRLIIYAVSAVAALLLIFGGYKGYQMLFPEKTEDTKVVNVGGDVEDSEVETKTVTFKIVDSDGDSNLKDDILKNLFIKVSASDQTVKGNGDSGSTNTYRLTYTKDKETPEKIIVQVLFWPDPKKPESLTNVDLLTNGNNPKEFVIQDLPDEQELKLSVKGSDIKLYNQISKESNKSKLNNYKSKVREVIDERNLAYGGVLADLLNSRTGGSDVTDTPVVENPSQPQPNPITQESVNPPVADDGIINESFDKTWLTLNQLNGMTPTTNAEKARREVLNSVLKDIVKGKCPDSADGLSKEQAYIVNQIIDLYNRIQNLPEDSDTDKQYKKSKKKEFENALRTNSSNAISKDPANEISLNTAKAALKIKI